MARMALASTSSSRPVVNFSPRIVILRPRDRTIPGVFDRTDVEMTTLIPSPVFSKPVAGGVILHYDLSSVGSGIRIFASHEWPAVGVESHVSASISHWNWTDRVQGLFWQRPSAFTKLGSHGNPDIIIRVQVVLRPLQDINPIKVHDSIPNALPI